MSAFLGLEPGRYKLPAPLSEDIVLIDRLLGTVLQEQDEAVVLEMARRLHANGEALDPALVSRSPELENPQTLERLLRAYAEIGRAHV